MADTRFEALKTKYKIVLEQIERGGTKLENLHVQDDKLFLKARAKTHADSNLIWDAIKRVEPNYEKDLTAQISFDSEGPPAPPADKTRGAAPATTSYVVRAGDTLSKIAKEAYGEASAYMRIFEANRDQLSDPDKIRVGQTLKIPH